MELSIDNLEILKKIIDKRCLSDQMMNSIFSYLDCLDPQEICESELLESVARKQELSGRMIDNIFGYIDKPDFSVLFWVWN